ncbi:unnamed protein product [Euphydryas editha]|uniref:Uncharacterized protein n=1 Tax=Euphydryas editha TaxID=104508 RepID=A0AAU9V3V6_EUPED|nr:unnamed protein product [Euphydryas editha]
MAAPTGVLWHSDDRPKRGEERAARRGRGGGREECCARRERTQVVIVTYLEEWAPCERAAASQASVGDDMPEAVAMLYVFMSVAVASTLARKPTSTQSDAALCSIRLYVCAEEHRAHSSPPSPPADAPSCLAPSTLHPK